MDEIRNLEELTGAGINEAKVSGKIYSRMVINRQRCSRRVQVASCYDEC